MRRKLFSHPLVAGMLVGLLVVGVCLASERKFKVKMEQGDKIFSVEITTGDSGTARKLAKEQYPKATVLDVSEVKEKK